MRIGLAQIDCELGNVDANVDKVEAYVHQAKDAGCDLVVFPEMADTGYEMQTILETASQWDDGPVQRLSSVAASAGIHVCVGLSERRGDRVCNSLAVLGPDGKLLAGYRKMHLFAHPPVCEDEHIQAGDSFAVVSVGELNIGLMICYDLRFPEMARKLVDLGADAIVLVAAWPFPREEHWAALIRARAIESQVYMLATNRVGTDAELTFCGLSQVVDPFGVVQDSADSSSERLLVTDIEPTVVQEIRERMPVLKHRRLDLYI